MLWNQGTSGEGDIVVQTSTSGIGGAKGGFTEQYAKWTWAARQGG